MEAVLLGQPTTPQGSFLSCPPPPQAQATIRGESPLSLFFSPTTLPRMNNTITSTTVTTATTTNSPTYDFHWEYLKQQQQRRRMRWLIGYLVAVGIIVLSVISTQFLLRYNDTRVVHDDGSRGGGGGRAILYDYLDLFRSSSTNHSFVQKEHGPNNNNHPNNDNNNNNNITNNKTQRTQQQQQQQQQQNKRHLVVAAEKNKDPTDYPQLVVAGKMTVEGGPCNIAQYNLQTKEWSLTERIQLSLYNSYSGGEVYSLLANHTFLTTTTTTKDANNNDDTEYNSESSSSSSGIGGGGSSSSSSNEQHVESTFRRYVWYIQLWFLLGMLHPDIDS